MSSQSRQSIPEARIGHPSSADSQVLPLYSQGGKGEPVASKARPSVQVFASAANENNDISDGPWRACHRSTLTRITLGKRSRVRQRELEGERPHKSITISLAVHDTAHSR